MPPRKVPVSLVPTTYPGKGMNEQHWRACVEMLDGVYKAKDGK